MRVIQQEQKLFLFKTNFHMCTRPAINFVLVRSFLALNDTM